MAYPKVLRWAALPPIVARASVSRLDVDALLRSACALKVGLISDTRFEAALKSYFATCLPRVWSELALADHGRVLLSQTNPYKTPLIDVRVFGSGRGSSLWNRRLAILRGLGVRLDLMSLAAGDVIEPHGHSQVVSGFLVLEGSVHGRTYDRLAVRRGAWLIRKSFDCVMGPGGFLTNAEWTSNVHGLEGRALRSLLLRVTVSGFPGRRFDQRTGTDRIYVDVRRAPAGCEPFWAELTDGDCDE